jgi:site-specific DNA-methyltransferase (adenine-specific)
MTPYYQDDLVTLYHGDCLLIAEWLQADVLVTDPPYGTQVVGGLDVNHGGYGRRQNAARNSRHASSRDVGREGFTIANDMTPEFRDRALALWGDKPAMCFGSPRMPDPPGKWTDRLVWDKKRPGMNAGPWRYRHESIFATAGFVRLNDAAVSVIEAWPDQAEHIHAKPLALMVKLVGAAPDGVIADPFCGSGSTLDAAKRLGRRAIGVELEERYCEIAARRLSQGSLAEMFA